MRIDFLLERLKKEFIKVNFIQSVVDSILLFLSLNLGLYLLSVQLISGIHNAIVLAGSALFFFAINWYYRSQKYSLEIYEEKNPELKEKLRTARDAKDESHVPARALFDDVVADTRKMTSETIIPTKRILQKITLVGVLSFMTVVSGMMGFQIDATSAEIMDRDQISESISNLGEDEEEFDFESSDELMGERNPINLSEHQVDYEIEGEGARVEEELSKDLEEELELGFRGFSDDMVQERGLALEYMREIRDVD